MIDKSDASIVGIVFSVAYTTLTRFWRGGQSSGADSVVLKQHGDSIKSLTEITGDHTRRFAVQDQINDAQENVNRQMRVVEKAQDRMQGERDAEMRRKQ